MEKSKKDLIKEYKQKKFKIGVFQIRNTLNNKIFIDSSMDLEKIFNRHRMQLNHGSHPNTELQKDWKESGEQRFTFETISEVDTDNKTNDHEAEAKQLKRMFIEEFIAKGEKLYNKLSS